MLPEVADLRTKIGYAAVREAVLRVAASGFEHFRIVHLSIQWGHLHLLVEADDHHALARGMKRFLISMARRLNRALGRRGQVFADRYHAQPVSSPRQARHVLAYVLGNWRRHRRDQVGATRWWAVDPYASAVLFTGWHQRADAHVLMPWPSAYAPLPVACPRTWLLRAGWRRHGLIDMHEVPGPPPGRLRG